MLRLSDVMERDVITVRPNTSLRDALNRLAARHVSGAPVVDGARVVGVISASDLLAYIAKIAQETALNDWKTPRPEDVEDFTSAIEGRTVAQAMTPWVNALPSTASVVEAAAEMQGANVHRLLVIDDEQLVGIVSAMDIVQAVAERRVQGA